MSWISELFNKKTNGVQVPINGDGPFFYPFGMGNTINWNTENFLKDFLEVPEVNAVITWKARAWSTMNLKVVSDVTGEDATSKDPIVRLIRQPNYFQSQKEFFMQTKIWQEIYGNEFLYINRPAAMAPNALFTLNPNCVDIEYGSEDVPFYMQSSLPSNIRYKATFGGGTKDITENVIHINNSNIDPDSGNWLDGVSPLQSLSEPIANIRASYEARNVIISNRGALGILSNGSVDGMGSILPMDPKEKEALQTALKGYGLSKNQHQFIVTNLNLKWQQMAVDSDKLQLHEENKAAFNTICDVLGVNYEIFANDNTFENKKAAERATYQNTIIPEAHEWCDALNRKLETNKKSWHIECSFDHLPIFAENLKDRAATLVQLTTALDKAFQSGIITSQDYKNELTKFKIGVL